MPWNTLGLALLVMLAGEMLFGHLALFWLLHRVARLPASLAIRLAHVTGLALGYGVACAWPATGWVVVCWTGAPWPGALLLGLALLWSLLLWLLPPGPGGRAG